MLVYGIDEGEVVGRVVVEGRGCHGRRIPGKSASLPLLSFSFLPTLYLISYLTTVSKGLEQTLLSIRLLLSSRPYLPLKWLPQLEMSDGFLSALFSADYLQVVRWSALIFGIGYGVVHQTTLQTSYDETKVR